MKRTLNLILVAIFLSACGLGGSLGELPTPQIDTNSAPDPESAVNGYLGAWNSGDYEGMYALLSSESKSAISFEDFQARYANVATQANLFRVDYQILQTLTNSKTAQVGFRVTLNSAVVGAITRDNNMNLALEGGQWRVVWADSIILPELSGGNTLSLERQVPARGNIYDRNGEAIVANSQAVAVGVFPSMIESGDEDQVVNELARVSQLSIQTINQMLFPENEDAPYYVSVAEVSADEFNTRAGNWDGLSGLRYQFYDTRLYFNGGLAPQTIGYYGPIPAENVPDFIPQGYQSDDYVGRLGIEAWGEEYLAGKRGGSLYVLDPSGQVVTKLADAAAQPADSVYTTIDSDLQRRAQEAIKDFTGAIVVLERDTGRMLAMVSSPEFNQNWADANDYNSDWASYFNGGTDPFFNRATQGQYPPGSIFKPITFSAAVESGVFKPESTFDCTNEWFGLAGQTLVNWTVAKELPPDGQLTLVEGLMRSCNPWFYQIGLELYNQGFKDAVTKMATGFGLGSPTGIQTVIESSGQVIAPDQANEENGRNQAVQQAFGQGSTLITPLQAAVYAAAIGNGGTLYQPQLVERVEDANGTNVLSFEPQIKGTLPISSATLSALQEGMRMVVASARGTAYNRFTGFTIPTYGKTGTATAGEGLESHAWFIGFTNAGRPSQPDIAIAVLVENIGDGSEFAAPIFR
ncbi:MAG TPA: penicillin-binding transpeptidase domain-containing protein, partial [Terriglobales bacterium]|nr:penicillin-binding transpeptidase domain-containing protein [Terriglobales bacterium]